MPNMNVGYRGPDPSLVTLTNELRAHYGNPARTYEFVTGYKSPSNYSGHNADSNGIVHAVDIFTDDHGNIPEGEGRALAERLRLIGRATNRFSYLIHDMSAGAPQPMITGQFNGWLWQEYVGADAHSDHIHLSIADGYWGDPCNAPAYMPNDTSRWGIASNTTAQAGNITPITEDDLMATPQQRAELINELLDTPIVRGGGRKGSTSLRSTIAYLDANLDKLPAAVLDGTVNKAGGGTTNLRTLVAWMDANLVSIKTTIKNTFTK